VVERRETCRLCSSAEVELVLPLAPSSVADAYVPADRLGEPQAAYPLDLFLCLACGHAQLLDVLDPEALFRDYIYTTASSPGLVEHFRRYAEELVVDLGAPAGALAVDVGSNDGVLLGFLKEAGMRVRGVDPAQEIARRATERGIPTTPTFFTREAAEALREQEGPAALVTANNVFAHADDLGEIADGIHDLLARDGVFVFEVSYLLDLVENMVFDWIYHEHLCYHSIKPLRIFLALHGMDLFDVQRVGTKGGSIRCFAQRAGGPRAVADSIAEFLEQERAVELDRPETFRIFGGRVNAIRDEVRTRLFAAVSGGAIIGGYGASATVTTLLHHFGLDEFLSFIVDDNPERQGLFSPGHHIPVVSRGALSERAPDEVVVLAWRFAEAIAKNNDAYLERGGRFLVPLPEVGVLDAATRSR
jgi:SAM-dependent methyltransferase